MVGRNGPKQSHAIASLTSPGSEHRILFVYYTIVLFAILCNLKRSGPPTENIPVEYQSRGSESYFGRLDSDPEPDG
jgi:hypothetical protein